MLYSQLLRACLDNDLASVCKVAAVRELDLNHCPRMCGDLRLPLTAAASNGHAGTVRILLEREDVDVNR